MAHDPPSSTKRPASSSPATTTPPYAPAAAGPGAVLSSLRYAWKTSGVARGAHVFMHVNQKDGFDCPGCAWPDPAHRATAEFCENGARAVAHEADRRVVDAAFFAAHSIADLARESDHALEHHGRLVEPMVKRPGATHYAPISWDDAFALVGEELAAAEPAQAMFYTSGRASNEAAFLYQLFARAYGTNNLPDCSNMCHESSGKGLSSTLGVGKGTVLLQDFEHADLIFIIGQNPGTNHPRMLTTLAEARARGAQIISINPLKERALQTFAHPQKPLGMLGFGDAISSQYIQVKLGGDVALLKGIMKVVLELDRERGGVIDRAFIAAHTSGYEDFVAALDAVSWDDVVRDSGVARVEIERAGRAYANAKATIACWAMGLTQHKHGVANVREVVNLLLLKGNIGRAGAGVCPVRGHSNVQGDRTMGVYEAPSEAFLQKLDAGTGITSPRAHGADTVAAIAAMERGDVRVFVGLGGNFASATPDTARTAAGLRRCRLTVQVQTKLNRSHTEPGDTALILPCLGRTERDVRGGVAQFVTVENSMGVVSRSEGRLAPAGDALRSEVALIAGIARATAAALSMRGDARGAVLERLNFPRLADNYDAIRDLIERSIEGFERFNARVRDPDGFVLDNAARDRSWHTASGKAHFTVQALPHLEVGPGQLVMMTIRSHDQFNTTVYEENDRYRGIYGERRVVFVNALDLADLGFAAGQRVDVHSHFRGEVRRVSDFRLVAYDIPRGSCAAYFPETNPLVPLESVADESHTPTSKSIVVSFHARATA